MFSIFDAHTHVYPNAIAEKACDSLGRFYDFSVNGRGLYDELESHGKECGYRGMLLLAVATTTHQVEKVNSFVAETVAKSRKNGFKTVGFGGMHQDFGAFEDEINRIVSLGLSGIKIHPDIQSVNITDPRLYPLYEILSAKGLPICFHMGDDRPNYQFSSPDKLKSLLHDFPRLKVIAAHFGGYKAFSESLVLLKGAENVKFDTSSSLWFMSKEEATNAVHTLGAENLFYGSDYPVLLPEEEIKSFLSLPLTEAEQEQILWKNAEEYFRLKEIL